MQNTAVHMSLPGHHLFKTPNIAGCCCNFPVIFAQVEAVAHAMKCNSLCFFFSERLAGLVAEHCHLVLLIKTVNCCVFSPNGFWDGGDSQMWVSPAVFSAFRVFNSINELN